MFVEPATLSCYFKRPHDRPWLSQPGTSYLNGSTCWAELSHAAHSYQKPSGIRWEYVPLPSPFPLSLSSLRPLRTFSLWKLNTSRALGVAVFTYHMRTVTFPQLWQRARVSLCLLPSASICIVFVLEDQGKGCRFKGHWDFSVLAAWEERAGLCSENVQYRKQKFMWSVSVLCGVSEGFTSSVLLWILDYCWFVWHHLRT